MLLDIHVFQLLSFPNEMKLNQITDEEVFHTYEGFALVIKCYTKTRAYS